MIDERDLLDPARNFTRSSAETFGIRIPELVIRQLIGYGLRRIRETVDDAGNAVDALFVMLDDEARRQLKNWLRDHANVQVVLNYPMQDASLPLISVVNQNESEETEGVFLNNRLGQHERGILLRQTINVLIMAGEPDVTMYLYYLVRFVLYRNIDQLAEYYDVQNLQISGQDLQNDQSLLPARAYVKTLQLQYQTFFDFNAVPDAADIVSIGKVGVGLLVDVVRDGVTPPVVVPYDGG